MTFLSMKRKYGISVELKVFHFLLVPLFKPYITIL
jgi:hypothetical protein